MRIKSDEEFPFQPRVEERSHQRRRKGFNCTRWTKRIWRSHGWTKRSLNYPITSPPSHPWRIKMWSCVLMLKYGGNVTAPKCYSRKLYCILTQTQCRYTCHHLPLRKVHNEQSHQRPTLHVWSILSDTLWIVSITVSLHTSFTVRGTPRHI